MPSTYCLHPTQSHEYSRYCHLSRKLPGGNFYKTDLLLPPSPEEFPTKKNAHVCNLYSEHDRNIFLHSTNWRPKDLISLRLGPLLSVIRRLRILGNRLFAMSCHRQRGSVNGRWEQGIFVKMTWSTKGWLCLADSQICGFSPQVVAEDIRQIGQTTQRVLAYTPQSQATPTRRRKSNGFPLLSFDKIMRAEYWLTVDRQAKHRQEVKGKDGTLAWLSWSEAPNSADGF